jgi:hypothetical protein
MRYAVLHSTRIDENTPIDMEAIRGSDVTLNERVNRALSLGATLVGGVSFDTHGNYLQAVVFPGD